MNILEGLKNFLKFVNDNWTLIVVIAGLAISLYLKIKSWLSLTNEERVNLAKEQIREIMLSLVSQAELDWEEYKKSGTIKRSQVIDQIFEQYPILSQVTDQESLLAWIDKVIDEALEQMHNIITKEE